MILMIQKNEKKLQLTEEEMKYCGISNKAKKSVYKDIIRQHEQPNYQGFERILRTKRIEEDNTTFNLQKTTSDFETYEKAPRIYEDSDNNNTLDIFLKSTMKCSLKKYNEIKN